MPLSPTCEAPNPLLLLADLLEAEGNQGVFSAFGYVPNERQAEFHAATEFDVVYGGSRGGGKTKALLMEGIKLCHERPGLRALLIRQSYTQLRKTIVNKELAAMGFARRIGCKWNGSDFLLTFPNGSLLQLGYCDSIADATLYQGTEWGLLMVDELTLIVPEALPILRETLRSGDGGKSVIGVRASCNPGGVGHTFIKTEYVEATEHGAKVLTDEFGRTRRFVPASVYDNLDNVGETYLAELMSIKDPARRAAMLDGDWNSFGGQVFEEWRYDRHVVPRTTLPPQWQRWCGIDYGRRDPWCAIWFAVDGDKRIWLYRELYETGVGVRDQARRILALEREAGEERGYVRHAIDPSTNNHLTDGLSIYEEYAQEGLPCILADNDRIAGWTKLHEALADGPICRVHEYLRQQGKWHQDTCPMLHVLADTCPNLVRTLPDLPYDKTRVEDVDTHVEDHAADALRYAIQMMGGVGSPYLREHEPPKVVTKPLVLTAGRGTAVSPFTNGNGNGSHA